MHQGSYYTLNKIVANENEGNNKQKRSELLQQMRNGMSDSSANTITITHVHSALREIKLSNEIVAFFLHTNITFIHLRQAVVPPEPSQAKSLLIFSVCILHILLTLNVCVCTAQTWGRIPHDSLNVNVAHFLRAHNKI